MKPESFDEQLSRFDLMCEGDPTFDLSDNDIAALLAVRTEMRIMARSTLASQERIAELEAKLAAKWISSDERLPEKVNHCSDVVLGWRPGSGAKVCAVYYNFAAKQWRTHKEDGFLNVTRWQPLPDAPVQP